MVHSTMVPCHGTFTMVITMVHFTMVPLPWYILPWYLAMVPLPWYIYHGTLSWYIYHGNYHGTFTMVITMVPYYDTLHFTKVYHSKCIIVSGPYHCTRSGSCQVGSVSYAWQQHHRT